ncbi:multidrug-efflux transporter [Niallia circulans]|jgi:MFS transporter, DHA1 family, multidrug resistance protein|uniref:MFS transporter n=1 Tax=Niallia circulans TaxID=1397 RepID=UPI00077C65DE|nr:MFS transporter [Niallia circulans]MDR4317720.1 MFS transporter [Niallia circulans]MED3841146.1 MFS transporter [Niallia circulans]MED4245723.1 MFS transporter [Niallia circulans]MED4247695.1 MFS transporter [Niallia circulans]MED5099989.1 MFS transporter [Niallia circulans]
MLRQNITLSILLINLFIAFLGIGLVIPVTPTIMNELHLSGAIVGYMVAAFAIAQLVVSPIAGRWADQFGRKRMIVIGLLIFGASELLFGIGKTVSILFLSRVLGGISAAFIMPAVTAFIADITTMEARPKALGYMSAAISTGFIIGPGIGGFLAEIGTRMPFYFAGILGFTAAILSFFALREPERRTEENQAIAEKVGWQRIFVPIYFISFLIIFISSFGLSSFESLFSLFVDHKFGFTPKDIAIIITGGATVGVIAQVALFEKLTKWMGEILLIRYSLLFSTILVLLLTIVHSYSLILLVTIIVFVGFDLMRPAVTTYLSRIAGDEQGFVGGMNSMFTSIGNVFGPIIGGILFDIDLNYPFYFAAVFLAIGIALTLIWRQKSLAKS